MTDAGMIRRGYAIRSFVGPNGGGKTLCAIETLLPLLDLGTRWCLSTVRILDYRNPRRCTASACTSPDHGADKHMAAHPRYIPWGDWGQCLEVKHCDIFADEISSVASSRQSMALPQPVETALQQMRKPDNSFTWTGPEFARADSVLRGVTGAVTVCRGLLPRVDSEGVRAWRNNRAFLWNTYDAALAQEFEANTRAKFRKLTSQWFWGPGSIAFSAYSTWDAVSVIGHSSEYGTCYRCGGSRIRPKCGCA